MQPHPVPDCPQRPSLTVSSLQRMIQEAPTYSISSKLPVLVFRALHELAFACSSLFPHLSLPWSGFQPQLTTLMCSTLFALSLLPVLHLINLRASLIIWGPVQGSLLLWSHLCMVVERLGSQADLDCNLNPAPFWLSGLRKVLDFSGIQSHYLENEDKSIVSWDREM